MIERNPEEVTLYREVARQTAAWIGSRAVLQIQHHLPPPCGSSLGPRSLSVHPDLGPRQRLPIPAGSCRGPLSLSVQPGPCAAGCAGPPTTAAAVAPSPSPRPNSERRVTLRREEISASVSESSFPGTLSPILNSPCVAAANHLV